MTRARVRKCKHKLDLQTKIWFKGVRSLQCVKCLELIPLEQVKPKAV